MKVQLFKMDGNKERTWIAECGEKNGKGFIIYQWGDVGGKLQVDNKVYSGGKNIGKKNETKPWQQAQAEMLAKVEEKKKKGYHIKGEAVTSLPLPMLALQFKDHMHKLNGKICVQPKYDGIRCVSDVKTGKMWSRRGTLINSCPHIAEELRKLNPVNIKHYLDGELYSDELTFQEITSIVRQENELHPDYKKIKYRVYDVIDINAGFEWRYAEFIGELVNCGMKHIKLEYIKEVPTVCFDVTPQNVMEKLESHYQSMLAEGYEGIMIRTNAKYRMEKRSDSLLKLKPMTDEEFKIVGWEKEKFKDTLGKFILVTKDGKEFGGRPSITHEELQKIYKDINSYIGKYATVRFQEYSDDGIPRFPVVKAIRWEGDMS